MGSSPHDGISPVDLLELPPLPGRIVRLLLRHGPLRFDALRHELDKLPVHERPDAAALEGALAQLQGRRWIERVASDPDGPFCVVLRRKPGRDTPA